MTPAGRTAQEPLYYVQLEFTHALLVPVGRYLAPDRCVLMIDVVEAQSSRRRRQSGGGGPEPAARPVSVQLVTYFATGGRAGAVERLRRAQGDPELIVEDRSVALEVLNRAIRAARAALGDPYVIEVTAADARATRVGVATPDELATGRWEEGWMLPERAPKPAPRSDQVQLGQEIAAAVQGEVEPFEAEELALRALLDLVHGRLRAAEAQARAAVVVFREEVGAEPVADGDVDGRLDAESVERIARHVLATARRHRDVRLDDLRAVRDG